MREYEVVFNVYGYTQLWYHSVGSVSYSRKIERKDGDGNIIYMLENGHISFTVEANSPEAAYEKAIILWMKTDTGLLTINGWNLRWVCNGENRWTKDDMDEDGNVALTVACEYVRDLSKPKYKGNYRIEVTFPGTKKMMQYMMDFLQNRKHSKRHVLWPVKKHIHRTKKPHTKGPVWYISMQQMESSGFITLMTEHFANTKSFQ